MDPPTPARTAMKTLTAHMICRALEFLVVIGIFAAAEFLQPFICE